MSLASVGYVAAAVSSGAALGAVFGADDKELPKAAKVATMAAGVAGLGVFFIRNPSQTATVAALPAMLAGGAGAFFGARELAK